MDKINETICDMVIIQNETKKEWDKILFWRVVEHNINENEFEMWIRENNVIWQKHRFNITDK